MSQKISEQAGHKIRKQLLEDLYARYNRSEFIHPDPLEFVFRYSQNQDREIAGLIAAVFAYGNVRQILASVEWILEQMGESPRDFIVTHSESYFANVFSGFKHRWHTDRDLCALLVGLKRVFQKYPSLESVYNEGFKESGDGTKALSHLVDTIVAAAPPFRKNLMPNPRDGSACKRLFLYLRWMIRCDDVDPGVWSSVPSSCLVVPVDTHLHRLAKGMKFTRRKQANLVTAVEITKAFGCLVPEDPVRYDFCLTRLGIRKELNATDFLRKWKKSFKKI